MRAAAARASRRFERTFRAARGVRPPRTRLRAGARARAVGRGFRVADPLHAVIGAETFERGGSSRATTRGEPRTRGGARGRRRVGNRRRRNGSGRRRVDLRVGARLGAPRELAILLLRGVQVLVLALDGGSEADHFALQAALRVGRVSGTRQGLGRTLGGISGQTRGGRMGRGSGEGREGTGLRGGFGARDAPVDAPDEDRPPERRSAPRGVPEGDSAGSAPASSMSVTRRRPRRAAGTQPRISARSLRSTVVDRIVPTWRDHRDGGGPRARIDDPRPP